MSAKNNIKTKTYLIDGNTEAIECLLIGVHKNIIGRDKCFTNVEYDEDYINRWMRCRYIIEDNLIYAQIPREISQIPDKIIESEMNLNYNNILAKSVVENDESIGIRYYAGNKRVVQILWDIQYDNWKIKHGFNKPSGEWDEIWSQ